jgi:serine/threonine-protein kinase
VILYEVLAGRHPFRADTFTATSDRILHAVPTLLSKHNPEVPAELERIVAKMLAKDPAERYATARDLLVDLRALRHERQPGPYRPGTSTAMRWLRTAALTVVLVALFTAAAPSVYRVLESVLWPIPEEKNVVVLPFEAIGGDDEYQAYADGLMQTLTAKVTTLTDTYNLQVTPASDVIEKGVRSAAEARTEFGANLVVEGSIHRVEATVRINCNLVDTVTRSNLRTRTITEDASDFFALEDRVVTAVLEMLRVEVESKEQTVLAAYGTSEPTAHKLYLQGRGYLLNYDKPENVESAIRNFQEALEIDPAYAQAHAGLGEAYWRKYEGTQESRWVEPARQNCERASGLSPDLAAAHICLGTLYTGTGRYQEAEGEFRRALEAESTSDAAYRGLALAQHRLGKLDQAEETYRRAIALRPGYWAGYDWLGAFYARELARFEDAAEQFEEAKKRAPGNVRVHRNLGGAYFMMGRYQDAQAALREALAIRPTFKTYNNLGVANFHMRKFAEAAEMFEEATELVSQDYLTWGNLARAFYWAPGQRDRAPAAYQRAVALAQDRLQVNPNDIDVRIMLAYYYAMLGEKSQSLTSLQQALQASPTNAEFLFWGAVIYNQFGEREQALEQLEQAIAGGYSMAELRTAVELDNLRDHPRVRELIGSP